MKKKPVIVCVDDQKEILDSLEDQILNRMGTDFECELAESGEEALELLQDLKEDGSHVAVIISDHLMPGMKGDEFLINAHIHLPDALKILLTGQASIGAVRNVINSARLYRYVEKPWDEGDLMMTISEASKSFMQHLQLLEYNRMLRVLNEATRELSSEIRIDRLFEKFISSAVISTEADRGFVLGDQEGAFNVLAVASRIQEEAQKLKIKQTEENAQLTTEVLNKVENALKSKTSNTHQIVTTIHNSNKNIGYVYVENSRAGAAFSSVQREIIQTLSSQAAISIENASLYQSLNSRKLELQSEKEKLSNIRILIEQKNQDVLDSIRYAKRIQESIMPDEIQLKSIFPDSFLLYLPKDIVSGDFYWWMEKDDKFLLATVDCTGHGVPGAFMSVMSSNFLNQIVNEFSITEPESILDYLNHRIIHALGQDKSVESGTSKDGLDLALCSYDKKTKTIKFSCANQPLYTILKQNNNENPVREIPEDKFSIGQLNEDGSIPIFSSHTLNAESGDIIILFTDGLGDQFGGPNEKKFSRRAFREILSQNRNLSMNDLGNLLREKLLEWKGELDQTDDILVIGIRVP